MSHYEDELLVIVPVLGRPKNVRKVAESFLNSDTPGVLYFIATFEQDQAEWLAIQEVWNKYRPKIRYLGSKNISWPRKIDEAYRLLRKEAEWFLFGADDIHFHKGWWQETKPLRDQPEIMVIGTNDLGNPRVIAGDHTTHPLVRSTYIGTVDDPKAIVHTGYRHWCVDDEFLYTAKARGVWVFSPTAIVEHLHPYWTDPATGKKKAHWDSTYAQGELNNKADMRLWRKRSKLLGLEFAPTNQGRS